MLWQHSSSRLDEQQAYVDETRRGRSSGSRYYEWPSGDEEVDSKIHPDLVATYKEEPGLMLDVGRQVKIKENNY